MSDLVLPCNLFFVVDGVDGCGKSTQLEKLRKYLEEKGFEVLCTREPFDENIRAKINAVKTEKGRALTAEEELRLFCEDRKAHVEKIIKPALESAQRKIIITDRFSDSTIAYQGYGRKLDIDFVRKKDAEARQGIVPHLVLIYDVPAEIGLDRLRKGREDLTRIEQEKIEFHKRVREGFIKEVQWQRNHHSPTSYRIIDASGSIDEVWNQTKKCIDAFFLREFGIPLEA